MGPAPTSAKRSWAGSQNGAGGGGGREAKAPAQDSGIGLGAAGEEYGARTLKETSVNSPPTPTPRKRCVVRTAV